MFCSRSSSDPPANKAELAPKCNPRHAAPLSGADLAKPLNLPLPVPIHYLMLGEPDTLSAARLSPDDIVRELRHLPSTPKVLPRLKQLLGDSNSSIYEIDRKSVV